jgi:hypothetical protein
MISTASTTGNHTLESELEIKHKETLDWLSSIKLWQKELAFFQTILDGTARYFKTPEDKKKVSRFQNLFLYYHAELLLELRAKLRKHENHLATIVSKHYSSESNYFNEHEVVISEMEQFSKLFAELKNDFFRFIEKVNNL